MNNKLKSILGLALPITLALALSYYMQGQFLYNSEGLRVWLESFGPFIILVYIILQSLSIIIAPIGGFVFLLAMIAIYGPKIAIILVFLVSTPCYLINFHIARRFGRPLVKKIIGEHGLKTVDHFARDAGTPTLVMLRIFQGMNFDYISYGVGLTAIPFKTFLLVNIFGSIPYYLLFYFVLTRFDNLFYSVIAFYVLTITFGGITILYTHLKRRHKKV